MSWCTKTESIQQFPGYKKHKMVTLPTECIRQALAHRPQNGVGTVSGKRVEVEHRSAILSNLRK